MLLDDLDTSLLPLLCRCEACMLVYTRSGVLAWFHAGEPLGTAEDCRLLVGGEEEEEGGGGGRAGAGAGAEAAATSAAAGSSFERGMSAFTALPQYHQAALSAGYQDFKNAFMGFLSARTQEAGEGGPTIIRKEDVEAFVQKFKEEQERRERK